jgi:hypothetical protein
MRRHPRLQGHNGLIGTGHFEGAIATVAQQLHDGRAYRNIGMEDQYRLNYAGTFTIETGWVPAQGGTSIGGLLRGCLTEKIAGKNRRTLSHLGRSL